MPIAGCSRLSQPRASKDGSQPIVMVVQKCPEFSIDIALVDHSDKRTLTPWRLPKYDELGTGTTTNQDYVQFAITITDNTVDTLEVALTSGHGTSKQQLFSKALEEPLRRVGTHEWRWDGYSTAHLLDTKVLKDPDLQLELRGEFCGITKTKILHFNNTAAEQDWVDVVIDRNAKTVTVELRVNLQDGGASGVGERPPAEVWLQHPHIPAGDPRRQAHVRVRSFNDLKILALSGLEKYWSRNARNGHAITRPDGAYTLETKPISATTKAMDDIDVEYNTNSAWGQSSNPGSVRGFFSLLANLVVQERSIYNVGWIKFGKDWVDVNPAVGDDAFQETSAHEMGHEILSAYGGEEYSYGHRGSSTVITQQPLDPKTGGMSHPATGEIDLMKYYNDSRPRDFFTRVVASETDVTSLIWLARVKFNE